MSLELPYQILNLFMVLTPSTTEGQADPVLPAPAHKYEMKPSCHPILASAFNRHYPNTSVMQHSKTMMTAGRSTLLSAGHVPEETKTFWPLSWPLSTCPDKFLNRVTVS